MMPVRRHLAANWFMQSRLKFRHLQVLAALLRHRKLHQAAASLGLSQPAASKLLIDLEAAIGQKLFDRHGRGLEQNMYGEILTRRAQAILAELDGARDEINAIQDGHLGRVTIGAIDGPIVDLLSSVLEIAQERHPRIEIGLEAGSSNFLLERLLTGHLDMMLGRPTPAFDRSMFTYEELGTEALCLVGRQGHPFQHRRSVDIGELHDASWVLQAHGSRLRTRVDDLFHTAGLLPPARVVSTNSLLMTLTYVARTNAISIVSEPVARQQEACGQLCILPLDTEISAGAYGLILPNQRPCSPSTLVVLRLLADARQAPKACRP